MFLPHCREPHCYLSEQDQLWPGQLRAALHPGAKSLWHPTGSRGPALRPGSAVRRPHVCVKGARCFQGPAVHSRSAEGPAALGFFQSHSVALSLGFSFLISALHCTSGDCASGEVTAHLTPVYAAPRGLPAQALSLRPLFSWPGHEELQTSLRSKWESPAGQHVLPGQTFL